ncbi:MJ1244 family protein [Methanotorris igneus]|uniref:Nitrogen regulatory protein P-II n=1 Tax=Methanotorris igneus (strain DSM 5666 / JCM 11834 / Kol 5) TaxID=880724 RepID=F6BBM9_METIK|nr:MJ1244 family protein [Methanotorris igneus]AEF96038.1 Protein of unknown function, nitrogen regulatory protein PII-related protein [Methanotorris igneus Kol 5]
MKVLVYLFIRSEDLGKAINALTEGGITGFFLYDYKGMSPQDWKGFLLNEDPESAVKIINDLSENAILIGTVLNTESVETLEKVIHDRLANDKYTIIEIPIEDIKVNMPDKE